MYKVKEVWKLMSPRGTVRGQTGEENRNWVVEDLVGFLRIWGLRKTQTLTTWFLL